MRCDAVTGIAGALLRMDSPWEVALPKKRAPGLSTALNFNFFALE